MFQLRTNYSTLHHAIEGCAYYTINALSTSFSLVHFFWEIISPFVKQMKNPTFSSQLILPEDLTMESLTPLFFKRHGAHLEHILEKGKGGILTKEEALVGLCAFAYSIDAFFLKSGPVCQEVKLFINTTWLKNTTYSLRKKSRKDIQANINYILWFIEELRKGKSSCKLRDFVYYPMHYDKRYIPSEFFYPLMEETMLNFSQDEIDAALYLFHKFPQRIKQRKVLKNIPSLLFSKTFNTKLVFFEHIHSLDYFQVEGKLCNWAQFKGQYNAKKRSFSTLIITDSLYSFQQNFKNSEELCKLVKENLLSFPQRGAIIGLRNSLQGASAFPSDQQLKKMENEERDFYTSLLQIKGHYEEFPWHNETLLGRIEKMRSHSQRLELLYQDLVNRKKQRIREWSQEDWILCFTVLHIVGTSPSLPPDVSAPLFRQFYQWKDYFQSLKISRGELSTLLSFEGFIKKIPNHAVNQLVVKLDRIFSSSDKLEEGFKLSFSEYLLQEHFFKIFSATSNVFKNLFHLHSWEKVTSMKIRHQQRLFACAQQIEGLRTRIQIAEPNNPMREDKMAIFCLSVFSLLYQNGHVNFLEAQKGEWRAIGAAGNESYNKKISGRFKPHIKVHTIHPEVLMDHSMQKNISKKKFRLVFFEKLSKIVSRQQHFRYSMPIEVVSRTLTSRSASQIRPENVDFVNEKITFCSQFMCTSVIKAAVETFQEFERPPPRSLDIFGLHPHENVFNILPDRLFESFAQSGLYRERTNPLSELVSLKK